MDTIVRVVAPTPYSVEPQLVFATPASGTQALRTREERHVSKSGKSKPSTATPTNSNLQSPSSCLELHTVLPNAPKSQTIGFEPLTNKADTIVMPRRPAAVSDYQSAVSQVCSKPSAPAYTNAQTDRCFQQIILSSSDSDFLDQLIPALKDAAATHRTPSLLNCFTQYSDDREADIERIGLTKHEEFLDSVNRLQHVREGTVSLTEEILELNQSIQASTEKLAEQKGALVNTKAVRQNIAEASSALTDSLKILHAVNHSHDLVRRKKYYSALKSLEDLQNEHLVPTLQNRYATQNRLADVIQKSIPTSQKAISEAVMSDLNTWLFRIRETSQFLGEVAFYHTEMRRTRQKKRMDEDFFLAKFRLNSSIELVCDESEEFDVLDNEDLQVDFTPLLEALHIHEALGQVDKFRVEYAATRRQQKDLLLPGSIELLSEDESSLNSLLEGIAGFAIIEKATVRQAPQLRSMVEVSLWIRYAFMRNAKSN